MTTLNKKYFVADPAGGSVPSVDGIPLGMGETPIRCFLTGIGTWGDGNPQVTPMIKSGGVWYPLIQNKVTMTGGAGKNATILAKGTHFRVDTPALTNQGTNSNILPQLALNIHSFLTPRMA